MGWLSWNYHGNHTLPNATCVLVHESGFIFRLHVCGQTNGVIKFHMGGGQHVCRNTGYRHKLPRDC